MNVTVESKELEQALKGLEPKVAKQIVKKAMRKGMKLIQSAAKDKAPFETGQTKKAIKVRAAKLGRKGIGIDVKVGEGDYKGETFYASFLEYGTSKMPPKPFMRPAYDSKKDQAENVTMNEIKEIIEQEADAK